MGHVMMDKGFSDNGLTEGRKVQSVRISDGWKTLKCDDGVVHVSSAIVCDANVDGNLRIVYVAGQNAYVPAVAKFANDARPNDEPVWVVVIGPGMCVEFCKSNTSEGAVDGEGERIFRDGDIVTVGGMEGEYVVDIEYEQGDVRMSRLVQRKALSCSICGQPAVIRDPVTAQSSGRSWVDCSSYGHSQYRHVSGAEIAVAMEKDS